MRWITTMILALMMVGVAGAIKECQTVMTSSDIPCLLVSSWEHRNPCSTYQAMVYNSTPALLDTRNLGANQIAGCNITFNYSRLGTYIINDTAGDYAVIKVEDDDTLAISIVLGIGITAGLLLLIAWKLDDEHTMLRLLITFTAVSLIILIPASFIVDAESIFYRLMIYFFTAFWFYVGAYFVYWILKKAGIIASGGEEEE